MITTATITDRLRYRAPIEAPLEWYRKNKFLVNYCF